jgi:hypothetical protein
MRMSTTPRDLPRIRLFGSSVRVGSGGALPEIVARGESPDAAALWEHAAKDRGAAVACGIRRPQSAADCDGNVMAEGNVSAESNEKMISPAVADPPDVKNRPLPAPLETLWTKTG